LIESPTYFRHSFVFSLHLLAASSAAAPKSKNIQNSRRQKKDLGKSEEKSSWQTLNFVADVGIAIPHISFPDSLYSLSPLHLKVCFGPRTYIVFCLEFSEGSSH